MAEFTSDMQQSYRPFSIFDIDPSMEMVSHFGELNEGAMENPNLNSQCVSHFGELNEGAMENPNLNSQSLMGFSVDSLLMLQQQQPEFPANLAENFPGIFHPHDAKSSLPVAAESSEIHDSKKRKAVVDVPESSSGNSSPPVSEGGIRRENSSGRGKRSRRNQKEEEKQKEVVHVRARRGQATDSHSLAERVRRGKINEKLRCLQGIVPGCYKTMGMAVMLDEIINYVQSLQNQVEFLSMKLTAASRYYDFSSETDAMEAMQRAKLIEAQKMQRLVAEGDQGLVSTQLIGSLDNTLGSYPSLPYNT